MWDSHLLSVAGIQEMSDSPFYRHICWWRRMGSQQPGTEKCSHCLPVCTSWARGPRASRMQGLGCMDYTLNSQAPHFSRREELSRNAWSGCARRGLESELLVRVRDGKPEGTAPPVFPDHPIFLQCDFQPSYHLASAWQPRRRLFLSLLFWRVGNKQFNICCLDLPLQNL